MDGFNALPNEDADPRANGMSLHVLAYNLKRLINMLGVKGALAAIRA